MSSIKSVPACLVVQGLLEVEEAYQNRAFLEKVLSKVADGLPFIGVS